MSFESGASLSQKVVFISGDALVQAVRIYKNHIEKQKEKCDFLIAACSLNL